MYKSLVIICTLHLGTPCSLAAVESCPPPEELPRISRKAVYAGMPFQPGEIAKYKVSYAGLHAGSGTLGVHKPIRVNGRFQRQFYGEAKTGSWYEKFFVIEDKILAKSDPKDFRVTSFYMKQNEGKIFSDPFQREKFIDFDQPNCKSKEKVLKDGKEKTYEFFLERGANDALSAFFHLRTKDFKQGKKETLRVYTSEKNWSLEATPIKEEKVKTSAGEFKAVKLKLVTYLGEELQQKGDVYMWIATDHPAKPMIQIQAQVKVGSFWMELDSFTPGKPL